MMHTQLDTAEIQSITGQQGTPGGPSAHRNRFDRSGRLVIVHVDALPHFHRREVANDRLRAADVVGVAVGNREIVEPADAAMTQCRSQHAIADVEVATA